MNPPLPSPGAAAQAFLSRAHSLFIGGRWVAPLSGRRFDVFDPGTGQKIATAAAGEAAVGDYATIAESEWRAFTTQVSSWDLDRYLDTV